MGNKSIQQRFAGLRIVLGAVFAFAILIGCAGSSVAADEYTERREKLIEAIGAQAAVPVAGAPGGRISEAVLAAMGGQTLTQFGGACVLPDNGVVIGLAAMFVPDNGGFALVGDAHRGDVAGLCLDSFHGSTCHILRVLP